MLSHRRRRPWVHQPRRWLFLPFTLLLMAGFHTLLFHPYAPGTLAFRCIEGYLQLVARASALVLRAAGEPVSVEGTTVTGRFPFEVVLDCAALDAQALFAAAVLAFPAAFGRKLVGLGAGFLAIALINVGRLVALYFAGVRSLELFRVLHEEVMVLLVIACVCGLFFSWARRSGSALPVPEHG
jgi:exosortase/archaeosortase family protein